MKSKTYKSGAVLYEIPYFADNRGALNVLEITRDLPFQCQRVFYTYAVPTGSVRGEHAHKECHQFLISVKGTTYCRVDNGENIDEIVLDSPSKGLHIPPGCWGEQYNHSPDSVLIVLASLPYDNADYIRSYDDFIKWRKGAQT